MIWLYRLLFPPALVLASPYYLYRMRKRGGYRRDWIQRFGTGPAYPPPPIGVKRIWIQAVSVGEVQALDPLLRAWEQRADLEVVLTTTTSTGYALARDKWGQHLRGIGLFPLDFLPCSRRAWDRIRPDLVLLMESEIWPEHLEQARRRGIPALLVNARLSDRSFRRYRRFPFIARWAFPQLDHVLAATPGDEARFRQLHPSPESVTLAGNLKLDLHLEPVLSAEDRCNGRAALGFASLPGEADPLVLLGSSTWPGEEAFLIETLTAARGDGLDVRLLLVPRHAERGDDLEKLLRSVGLPWSRRSTGIPVPTDNAIYLADTTGELRILTQLADLAFIGKSLPPQTEGQSPIECAAFGIPLVTGPGMSNFRDIVDGLVAADGCRRANSLADVRDALLKLLREPEARHTLAAHARQWREDSCGATAVVIRTIDSLLNA